MTRAASLSDFTGATIIRYETADGTAQYIDDAEAARRVNFGDIKFRGMMGNITGDMVEPYLYRVLGIDPHRFVFDLPSSMRGTGQTRVGAGNNGAGSREGFVHRRGDNGKPDGNPVGKIIFLTYDRKFREGDPTDRRDFEAMR